MRSPFHTLQNHLTHPKPTHIATPITATTFHTPTNNTQYCNYEPTSVLEPRRSPSPVNNFAAVSDECSLHWDDHGDGALLNLPPASEDWDSMMMLGLTEKDDSTLPLPTIPASPFLFNEFGTQNLNFNAPNEFYQNNDSLNLNMEFDCSQLDQLIRAAALVESNDTPSAQVILARLNQLLQSASGKPLQRTAFYFKEALQFLLSGSNFGEILHQSPSDMVQKIKAYKAFSELSPITMFANFTANQTLLEALDGSMFIHIIDFEIGIGGQWASFMQEIACKAKSRNILPSSLRITAVVSEESMIEASLISDNLQQFAREVGIQFQLDFVMFDTFQELLFNSVRFMNGETVAVNLSPKIFRHLRTPESINGFLRFLRRISPRVTVFIEFEGGKEVRGPSFRKNIVGGIEFFSSLLESLDVASGGDADLVRRIERYLLRHKIFATVFAAGNGSMAWRDLFSSVGMVPVQLSEFTDSQAEWLVRRAQIRGFHVVKRHGSMLLCWHDRELVATSAWRC